MGQRRDEGFLLQGKKLHRENSPLSAQPPGGKQGDSRSVESDDRFRLEGREIALTDFAGLLKMGGKEGKAKGTLPAYDSREKNTLYLIV